MECLTAACSSGFMRVLARGPQLIVRSLESSRERARRAAPSAAAAAAAADAPAGPAAPAAVVRTRYAEYYPLLVRRGSDLVVRNIWLFWPDGTIQGARNGQEVEYSGPSQVHPSGFRPVVVYELTRFNQRAARIMLAVVHTTPAGTEFERREIFGQQIRGVLRAARPDGLWVFLGDFYLTAEARVLGQSDLAAGNDAKLGTLNEERNALGLTFASQIPSHLTQATPISGTNPQKGWYASRDLSRVQIADFFVVSRTWVTSRVGIFRDLDLIRLDGRGGLLPIDSGAMALEAWSAISDHAPVGAFLATFPALYALHRIFGYDDDVKQIASHDLMMFGDLRKLRNIHGSLTLSIEDFDPQDARFLPNPFGSGMAEEAEPIDPRVLHESVLTEAHRLGVDARFDIGFADGTNNNCSIISAFRAANLVITPVGAARYRALLFARYGIEMRGDLDLSNGYIAQALLDLVTSVTGRGYSLNVINQRQNGYGVDRVAANGDGAIPIFVFFAGRHFSPARPKG